MYINNKKKWTAKRFSDNRKFNRWQSFLAACENRAIANGLFFNYGYCRYCKDRKNIKTSRNEARLFSRVAKCEIRLFKSYGIQLVCWRYNSKSRHTCNSCNDVWGEDRRFSRISEGGYVIAK